MKNFGKYFFLILAFLSIGAGSAFAKPLQQFGEELPLSSEDLKPAGLHLWAYRENPFQEIYDLSENHFFKCDSVVPFDFLKFESIPGETKFSHFNRDLRRDISMQIFPKHFFL